MAKKFPETAMEAIVTRVMVYGESIPKAAEATGFSTETVSRMVIVFTLVRDQQWDKLITRVEKLNATPAMINWAARKLGVNPPMDKIEAASKRAQAIKTQKYKQQEEALKEVRPEIVKTLQAEALGYNEDLYLSKILMALNSIDEHLVQLMDVVLPKYVADLKDNANANGDAINSSVQTCVHYLDGIRCNTRKRGL